ncbi:MAG: hypothetical protein J5962_00935 [Lachnospiraceae bacterium]|nr:hypothetical protein [Lachnospiraceae bacterium]
MAFKEFLSTVKNEASDAVEVTKIKSKISKEKTLIKEDYQKLGEIIYNRCANGCDDAELANIVSEITAAKARIKELNNDIDRVNMK